MLKSLLDSVMERRARLLIEQVRAWLPPEGPLLDLGPGTDRVRVFGPFFVLPFNTTVVTP